MSQLLWDFDRMPEFIKKIRGYYNDMQEEQLRLEKSYLDIGTKWSDDIYNVVGQYLYEVARGLKRIFNGLRDSLIETGEVNKKLSEYNNDLGRTLPVNVPDFKTNLTGEKIMQKTKIKTDPEALIGFCADLRNYIAETRSTVAAIESEHRNMADAWIGRQYDEFGEIVSEIRKNMEANLSILESQNIYIMYKAQIIEEVDKRSINSFRK